jgi:hypothetical protein
MEGKKEGRKYGQALGAGFQYSCFSLLGWLEFGHTAFLDCVPCLLDICERRSRNNHGNGDGRGADDAPWLEYRIERLPIRTIKKKSFS